MGVDVIIFFFGHDLALRVDIYLKKILVRKRNNGKRNRYVIANRVQQMTFYLVKQC